MRKINYRFNHLSKWLFAGAVTIIALLTVFIGGPSNASAAPFNLNNMRWGLLPAGDPTTPDGPATYSLMRTPALDARDWNPSPDYNPGNLENFGTTAGNTVSLQNPYVVGTSSPKVVAMDKDNYNQSDAQVGDTITQYDSSKFLVTGVSLGAYSDMMYAAAGPSYDGSHTSYRPECDYFDFKVEEVNTNGDVVPKSGLYVVNSQGYQYPTILGFDKMANKNDLAKVTITPLNNDKGKLFTGSQTLYLSLTGSGRSNSDDNYGYSTYQSSGTIDNIKSMLPNTAQNPINTDIPSNGELYLSDLNDGDLTEWTTDNPNLRSVQDSSQYGYKITGLNSLKPGTVVKFTGTDPLGNGKTNVFYFKFGTTSTPGTGGSSSGSTTTPNTSTATPTTDNSATTSSLSSSTPATSSSSTTTTVPSTSPSESGNVEVKGGVIYATKKIALYKSVNFTKANRIVWYPKQKRINRPMFVVTGYARSANGTLRYQVRDVNHGHKTAGKTGYVTASRKYVIPVYYASLPKSKKITVISKKGIYAYKSVKLTGKSKHYKKGIRLTVKKLVKHNLTTRYQLSNGWYVTTNKKLVIGSD